MPNISLTNIDWYRSIQTSYYWDLTEISSSANFSPYWIEKNMMINLDLSSYMITLFMSWKISFFNDKVAHDTYNFPKGILANFLHIIDMIEELGPSIGMPYTKPMGKGLKEVLNEQNQL